MVRGPENQAINVVRTIAAALVVLGHLRALFFQDYGAADPNVLNVAFYAISGLGHEAVMVFFVLSGFWVGGAVLARINRQGFSWTDYAVRRLTRLWIVVIPGLAITAICTFLTLHFFPASDVAIGSVNYHGVAPADLAARTTSLVGLGNVVFLQDILVPTFGSNGPLWSLAYEFWFYAMFPLLVLIARASNWRARLPLCVALLLCASMAGISIVSYLFIWLLGAALSIGRHRVAQFLDQLGFVARLALRLLSAIALGGLMLGASTGALGVIGDPIVALAATAFLATLIADPRPNGFFGRVQRGVGRYADASFSLYVVHLPILALLAAAVIPNADDRMLPSARTLLLFLALFGAVLVAGWVFASLTEFHTERLRRWVTLKVQAGRRGL